MRFSHEYSQESVSFEDGGHYTGLISQKYAHADIVSYTLIHMTSYITGLGA